MASTNKTSNYELSQFLGTDKPAWLSDYNSDMNKIDTQMKANADAATAAGGSAGAATTAIGTLDNLTTDNKTNLVSAINEVDSNADTAQNTANSANDTATTAKNTAESIASAFDFNQAVSSTVTSSNVSISSASTVVSSFANDTGTIGKIYGRIKGTTNSSTATVTFPSELRPDTAINVDGLCFISYYASSSDTRTISRLATMSIATNGVVTITTESLPVNTEINFYIFAGLIFAKNLGDIVITA